MPAASPIDADEHSLEYVVILGNPVGAFPHRGVRPEHKMAFLCVDSSHAYEAAHDVSRRIADGMGSSSAVGIDAFRDRPREMESARKLLLCRFSAEQPFPWEAVLAAANVDSDGQRERPVEAGAIGLGFGDASTPARAISAIDPAPSDHLLLSHTTHVPTVLHCEEALISGSLIGMSGSRWSDAMCGSDPGLARWRAVFEAPAATCCCETMASSLGAGCLGPGCSPH